MNSEPQIVKVQISIFGSRRASSVLIYNEDESILEEFELSPSEVIEMKDKLKGELKQYFYATYTKGIVTLHDMAPWQRW